MFSGLKVFRVARVFRVQGLGLKVLGFRSVSYNITPTDTPI